MCNFIYTHILSLFSIICVLSPLLMLSLYFENVLKAQSLLLRLVTT